MKKLFAVVLTVVMLFAVCVPAFATDITDKTANTADANIYTSTETDTDYVAYIVTIPADTEIKWGATKTLFQYSIKTQLELGKRLSVTVTNKDGGANELSNASTSAVLPYSFSYTNGGAKVESFNYVTDTEVTDTNRTFNIEIAKTAWDAAPIAQYSDILTFTVDVVDAAPVAP